MTTTYGDDTNNIIIADNNGDTIYGLGGDDQLIGGTGDDTLDGGTGHDLLSGGPGHDILTGGPDSDIYRDTAANLNGDEITDLKVGDRIQITDLPPASANISTNGNMILYGNGDSVTVDNLGPGRLVVRPFSNTGIEIRLQQDAHNDFSGDGLSDILWRSNDGTVRDWLGHFNAPGQSDGNFVGNTANLNVTVGSDWQIAGTGDFNGDSRVDILWRGADGTVRDWLGQANGGFSGNAAYLNVKVGNDWHIVGTGDFNGDGITDILWQNTDGTVHDWLGQSNGGFVGNTANLNISVPSNWHVEGTGDFNGDGIDDILWRSDDGTVHDWLGQSNGGFVSNTANLNVTVGNDWHIVGTGDFNGDGITDILWRGADGTVRDWLGQANGGFSGNTANLNAALGTDWHVVAIGDYNGDAVDDLLLRNNNGATENWLGQANGGFVDNSANVNISVPTDWHVQDPFVHDPIGI